jgi:hypothetical protein
MWPSPNKIPTKISLISLGIVIRALSADDNRLIPFVELALLQTVLNNKNRIVNRSC